MNLIRIAMKVSQDVLWDHRFAFEFVELPGTLQDAMEVLKKEYSYPSNLSDSELFDEVKKNFNKYKREMIKLHPDLKENEINNMDISDDDKLERKEKANHVFYKLRMILDAIKDISSYNDNHVLNPRSQESERRRQEREERSREEARARAEANRKRKLEEEAARAEALRKQEQKDSELLARANKLKGGLFSPARPSGPKNVTAPKEEKTAPSGPAVEKPSVNKPRRTLFDRL